MLCINEAKYAGGYNIQLIFNNGMEDTANLERTIFDDKRRVFSKLTDVTRGASNSKFHLNSLMKLKPKALNLNMFLIIFKSSQPISNQ